MYSYGVVWKFWCFWLVGVMFLFKLNYSLLFWLSQFTFSRILIMYCLCVLCYLPYFVCTCKFITARKVLKHVLALSMVVNLYGIQAWTYEWKFYYLRHKVFASLKELLGKRYWFLIRIYCWTLWKSAWWSQLHVISIPRITIPYYLSWWNCKYFDYVWSYIDFGCIDVHNWILMFSFN